LAYSGRYRPKNPQKYRGDVHNIVWRSTWERKFFRRCDLTPSILKWSSEEVVIPYISPIDNRRHRYFIDVWIRYISNDGSIQERLIEIKPYAQTLPPKAPKRKTKRYIQECVTYEVNQAKWRAASAVAKANDMDFLVLTEHELGIK